MEEKGFEMEFQSEQEAEEMLDAFIHAIGEAIEEEEDKPAVIVPNRMLQMQYSYAAFKQLIDGTDAKISYGLNEPYKSMGDITIEAGDLTFTNVELFTKACSFASNLEVYPLVNGNVRLTLTFHGIAKSI